MNLAIIVAGESSRLKEYGLNVPKHLITINGEYQIDRIIKIGYENGFQKVYCIINTKEKELKKNLLEDNFKIPLKLIVKDTESSLLSLFALSPFLSWEPFCLATTDSVFFENEFTNFLKFSSEENLNVIFAVTLYLDDEKLLFITMDEDGTILKFSNTKEGYSRVTCGVYYFQPGIFSEKQYALETGTSRLRNFLRLLITRGYTLKGFPFSKKNDVDHLNDIEKAEELLTGHYHSSKEKK